MFFTVFVNTALALRRSNVVRKFRLDCDYIQNDPFCAHSIDTWISTAIGPHLEEFHLNLLNAGFNNFPLKLLSCSNLVSLRQATFPFIFTFQYYCLGVFVLSNT
jgi:hypothetical protein